MLPVLLLDYAASYAFKQAQIAKMAKDATAKSVLHMAFIVRKTSKDSMERSLHGEPSKEGQPPNIQRGKLNRSIRVDQPNPFHARVFANIEYAAIHELGNYYGRKVPKRPFLLPALKREYQRLPHMAAAEMSAQANWSGLS